jgi:Mor family transcriptional regulator
MGRKRKNKRNEELVKKRKAGWSYGELAEHYRIDKRAAWEIYQRDKNEFEITPTEMETLKR